MSSEAEPFGNTGHRQMISVDVRSVERRIGPLRGRPMRKVLRVNRDLGRLCQGADRPHKPGLGT